MVSGLKKRIGLFGGSFNPAHEGHIYISEMALLKLGLDEIWWLVAPGNPLKDKKTLAPYQDRLEAAQTLAAGRAIVVRDFERHEKLTYTFDTVNFVQSHYPSHSFIWIMGADCFLELPKWREWQALAARIPFAVFPRPGYTEAALSGEAAETFAENRLADGDAQNLVVTSPPAWVYIDVKPVQFSGTEIRKGGQG